MLREAIESVAGQSFQDFEHIIVDGGSSDGTAELLARFPHLRVIREPDQSVYDAMNKGFRAATGEFIFLLNSDDLLPPGALQAAAAKMSDPELDLIAGAAKTFEGDRVVAKHAGEQALRLTLENISLGNPLPNVRFYRRRLVKRAGDFDLRYRLGSDRDWLLRVLRLHPREAILEAPVYCYRRHAGSLTINDHSRLADPLWRESMAIAEDWLSRTDLAPEERVALTAWHRQQSIQASLHFIRHGPRSRALEYIRRGGGGCAWWYEWSRRFAEAAAGFVFPRRGPVQ
jgi:glycosyltransferase involved in cell wall biosynthesis